MLTHDGKVGGGVAPSVGGAPVLPRPRALVAGVVTLGRLELIREAV